MTVGAQILVDITIGEFEDWADFWKYWDGLTMDEKMKLMDEAHHAEIIGEKTWCG